MTEVIISLVFVVIAYYFGKSRGAKNLSEAVKAAETTVGQQHEAQLRVLEAANKAERGKLEAEIASLAKYRDIADAEATVRSLRDQAVRMQQTAQEEANAIRRKATEDADAVRLKARKDVEILQQNTNLDLRQKRERVEKTLEEANKQAAHIIQAANTRAEQVAGDALRALKEADSLKATALAMKNVIDGYGDRYLRPTYSLLDELAENYSFDEAGKQLKLARDRSKLMVEHERAATCDYVERNRRETAIRFVTDAFNGKVDSILSRSKADNVGTLEQQIRDAFALVNFNGTAFRDARITVEYLAARLDELKWAASVMALRDRDREEQRRIKEQIREEEKARREIEKALKDVAKEEEMLLKAMEKVQAQVAKADASQRAGFEARLAELQSKLAEAEAKNQRALSMAQQTRAGHVYIISNVSSFGEDVLKVGMTRRLEPLDRVRELGDASVPFSFDVHAMLWSEDAPSLERDLHKKFLRAQLNKVNPRKEFFRIPVSEIRKEVESMNIDASWTVMANAAEYRETKAIELRLAENAAVAAEWERKQMEYAAQEGAFEPAEEG